MKDLFPHQRINPSTPFYHLSLGEPNISSTNKNQSTKSSEAHALSSEDESWVMLCEEELGASKVQKNFDFASVKTANTPIETQKPLVKDEEASDVDVHLYRSMIGSLMYVTASRPDIMFAVCACSRFQVTPKTSHLKAEYVAAASCCGQVLWIQNQMLDYGFNFMNTKIYIDNESTICIVKNPVYHSKTKHIAIRHHFIRDAYEKKLIQETIVNGSSEDEIVWTSAKSKTNNNSGHITGQSKLASFVSISEASIRTDLNFDDADGIDSLPNQAIFDAIQRMGYEGD
ncbi:hypothetical protein Tco_0722604 [Tanacetum coccineum]